MFFLAAGVLLIPLPASAVDDTKAFPGTWEYRQRAGEGYDAEGERIELLSNGTTLAGLYFGLEREGEHGLFYTAVELKDIKVEQGVLFFTVPERHLYTERPKSVKQAKLDEPRSSGYTRDELKMQAQLKGGSLMIACQSALSTCPDRVMEFRKNKWDKN
jgi:hypothetical protein